MLGVLTAIWKMSNRGLFIIAFALFCMVQNHAQPAHGQLARAPLTASDIKQFMFGTTMSGQYASGKTWAETFNRDGTSQYAEDGKTINGKMTLNGHYLCFTYNADPSLNGGCFEVWKRGANCFDFYSVGLDSPSASMDQRRFGRGWDARAWYANQQSTCLSEEIS
jgi:hypothetical protein